MGWEVAVCYTNTRYCFCIIAVKLHSSILQRMGLEQVCVCMLCSGYALFFWLVRRKHIYLNSVKRLLIEKHLVNCETQLVCLWSKGWSEGCRTVRRAVHQTGHLSPPALGECVLCTGEIVRCAGKVLSRGWHSVTHLLGQPQPAEGCGGRGGWGLRCAEPRSSGS